MRCQIHTKYFREKIGKRFGQDRQKIRHRLFNISLTASLIISFSYFFQNFHRNLEGGLFTILLETEGQYAIITIAIP